MTDGPCNYGYAHDWAQGTFARWCLNCWVVQDSKPDSVARVRPRIRTPRPSRSQRVVSVPHRRPWATAESRGQSECRYCCERFSLANPPTYDHKLPVSRGGQLRDGWVLACQLCNGARGDCLYEKYVECVDREWRASRYEGRAYRRPKWDGFECSTRTRRERRDERRHRLLRSDA